MDEKPLLAAMQSSLKLKLPPEMIITSTNLRLGELIGQGKYTFLGYLSTCNEPVATA